MGYGLTIPYSTVMGLSREDWTTAALDALAEVGLSAVAIDPLARRLGATKGSFYWHFSSRDELIAATLELWERRDTLDLVAALEAIPDPQERLVALARSAYGTAARGTDPQAGVLAAASDPRVGPVLERVTVARLASLERLFGDAGLGSGGGRAPRPPRLRAVRRRDRPAPRGAVGPPRGGRDRGRDRADGRGARADGLRRCRGL